VVTSPFGGVIYDTGSHVLDLALFILSLDEPTKRVEFSVKDIDRSPLHEPSHEVRARLALLPGEEAPIDLRVMLSRVEPLAGVIKVFGQRGTLLVPTSFAASPLVVTEGVAFSVARPLPGVRPIDAYGCLIVEHLDFAHVCRNPRTRSILDAERFSLLTGLLETLAGS